MWQLHSCISLVRVSRLLLTSVSQQMFCWSTLALEVLLKIKWTSDNSRSCKDHLQLGAVRAPAAQAGGPGFDPRRLPWVVLFFFYSSWLTNVDEMKDLWCSGTVQLPSTQIWDMNRAKDLWCSSTVWLLSTQIWIEGRWCSSTVWLLSTDMNEC